MVTCNVTNQWGLQFPFLIVLWLKVIILWWCKTPRCWEWRSLSFGRLRSLWILFPEWIPLRETLCSRRWMKQLMAEGKIESKPMCGFSSSKENLGKEGRPWAWPPLALPLLRTWLSFTEVTPLSTLVFPVFPSHTGSSQPHSIGPHKVLFPFPPSISWQTQKEFRAGVHRSPQDSPLEPLSLWKSQPLSHLHLSRIFQICSCAGMSLAPLCHGGEDGNVEHVTFKKFYLFFFKFNHLCWDYYKIPECLAAGCREGLRCPAWKPGGKRTATEAPAKPHSPNP